MSKGLGHPLSLYLLHARGKHNCFSLARVTAEEKSSPAQVTVTALSSQPQPSQRGGSLEPREARRGGPQATYVST